MTRERLLRLIRAYYCIDVPISVCDTLTCADCAEKVLTEYENKIYNQALDDFQKALKEISYTNEDNGYMNGTLYVSDLAVAEINLKKGTEE